MSKIKKIITVFFVVVFIFVSCFSLSTSAVTGDCYTFPMSQPPVSSDNGYVELLVKTRDGSLYVDVYMFNLIPTSVTLDTYDDSDSYCQITVSNNVISFLPVSIGALGNYKVSLISMSEFGSMSNFGSSQSTISINYNNTGKTIVGFHCYGDYQLSGSDSSVPFTVLYSFDAVSYNTLLSMLSILKGQNQEIIENDDKNTQEIIDNQNQLQENEKNEAETQGQGSVDAIGGAIEDKSAGFISAISSLVSSMSYNGTACAWPFPALKLPAIEGVMPEIVLTESQSIDFEFWVEKIPSNVLLLVRSLLTIALIGFCFKELYSTISYVLTLKGGSGNE